MNRRVSPLLTSGSFVLLLAASGQALADRSETFQTYCVACHGDDGKANTEEGKKKGARDLTNKKWQASVADERLQKSITKGRDKMPKFATKLTEDEIKALVNEVRSLAK
jgi:cytochrome c oxidase cbb3-type subunit 3